jgi:hypothetical protein
VNHWVKHLVCFDDNGGRPSSRQCVFQNSPTPWHHRNPLLARACLLCFNWDDSEFFRGSTLLLFFLLLLLLIYFLIYVAGKELVRKWS